MNARVRSVLARYGQHDNPTDDEFLEYAAQLTAIMTDTDKSVLDLTHFNEDARYNNPVMSLLFTSMKSANPIRCLVLRFCAISVDDANVLAEMLRENNTLESLDFGDCYTISSEVVKILFAALENNASLRMLNLYNVQGATNAMVAVSRFLARNKSLVYLDLNSVRVPREAVPMFADALSQHPQLTTLNILDPFTYLEDEQMKLLGGAVIQNANIIRFHGIIGPDIQSALIQKREQYNQEVAKVVLMMMGLQQGNLIIQGLVAQRVFPKQLFQMIFDYYCQNTPFLQDVLFEKPRTFPENDRPFCYLRPRLGVTLLQSIHSSYHAVYERRRLQAEHNQNLLRAMIFQGASQRGYLEVQGIGEMLQLPAEVVEKIVGYFVCSSEFFQTRPALWEGVFKSLMTIYEHRATLESIRSELASEQMICIDIPSSTPDDLLYASRQRWTKCQNDYRDLALKNDPDQTQTFARIDAWHGLMITLNALKRKAGTIQERGKSASRPWQRRQFLQLSQRLNDLANQLESALIEQQAAIKSGHGDVTSFARNLSAACDDLLKDQARLQIHPGLLDVLLDVVKELMAFAACLVGSVALGAGLIYYGYHTYQNYQSHNQLGFFNRSTSARTMDVVPSVQLVKERCERMRQAVA